jgi:hypothetical protein
MSQKVPKVSVFVWDATKEKAADAIAKGDRSLESIGTELGTCRKTLCRWMKHPDFAAKVDEITQDVDITLKKNRLKIIKKEIKRVLDRLDLNEDRPSSRDLVALMKLAGDEIGDLSEHKVIKIIWDDDAGTDN